MRSFREIIRPALLACLCWAALFPALAEADAGVRLMVAPTRTGAASLKASAKTFCWELQTELQSMEEVILIEKEKIDQIVTQQGMQMSELYDDEKAVAVGRLLGAQYMLFSDIEPLDKSKAGIQARIVSVETGVIAASTSLVSSTDALQGSAPKKIMRGLLWGVSSSGAQASFPPLEVLDGDMTTCWLSPAATTRGWLEFKFPFTKKVHGVSIEGRSDGDGMPQSFKIKSLTRGKWSEFGGEYFNTTPHKKITKEGSPPMERLRIEIDGVIVGKGPVRICEVEFE